MVAVGVLFVLPFGALGCFLMLDALKASSVRSTLMTLVGAAIILAPAAYGAWLAWRATTFRPS